MPSLHKPDRNEPILLLAKALDPGGGETLLIGLEAMRELNYVEGRNLAVHRAAAAGRIEDLVPLARNLVDANVDVIVTTASRETRTANAGHVHHADRHDIRGGSCRPGWWRATPGRAGT